MDQIVKHKRSVVSGKAPSTLEAGEFAVNLVDKVIYAGAVDKSVFELCRHYDAATSTKTGLMSSEDKQRLDSLSESSVVYEPITDITDILD